MQEEKLFDLGLPAEDCVWAARAKITRERMTGLRVADVSNFLG